MSEFLIYNPATTTTYACPPHKKFFYEVPTSTLNITNILSSTISGSSVQYGPIEYGVINYVLIALSILIGSLLIGAVTYLIHREYIKNKEMKETKFRE
jgi:large-conductance mechanosensitive channel